VLPNDGLDMLDDFRVEDVLQRFVRGHVLRVLFYFRHGVLPMRDAITLPELIKEFGDDESCRRYIEALRWRKGVICPRCDKPATAVANRSTYDCDACHYQFSATSGTIFHDTHLPLTKWFLATYLLCESKKGMSACQIQRTLGISYKTAWYLCHRIRAAMLEVAPEKLSGTVEIDETYVGGKKRRWRPKSEKQVVIGIRQRNGDLRLIRAEDARAITVRDIMNMHLGSHVEVIMTDESAIYPYALDKMQKSLHRTINHTKEYAHGDVHTNTVESAFSLLKRGIVGTWHKVSAKHLPAYLDEMCFRFNNRKNQFLFRDTLIKLILSPNLEYKDLTAKVQDAA
jgi:transposase-like protein